MNKKYVFLGLFVFFLFFALVFDCNKIKTVFNFHNMDNQMLIIDAGHGGLDGGAIGNLGTTEDDITLAISLKMSMLCDFLGIKHILTRSDENSLDFNENVSIKENKVADTRARTKLVNSFENAVLISVHLNKFTDESSKGAQIFYNTQEKSEVLAGNLQKIINNSLDLTNNRQSLKVQETVYLTKNSIHPAIIFECGFLSNYKEELLLIDEFYQTKLAICAISAYILE